jgi:hypothetical protein
VLDRGKEALDQSATLVKPSLECPPDLDPHSIYASAFLSALRGHPALRPELLPNIDVLPLAIESGVGQNQPDGRLLESRCDDSRQICAVVPRPRRAICDSENF